MSANQISQSGSHRRVHLDPRQSVFPRAPRQVCLTEKSFYDQHLQVVRKEDLTQVEISDRFWLSFPGGSLLHGIVSGCRKRFRWSKSLLEARL